MKYPNWFEDSSAKNYFDKFLSKYAGQPIKFLQIGAYKGDASKWMLDNVLTHNDSALTDVDTWQGSQNEGYSDFNWKEIESIYDEVVSGYSNVIKKKMTSNEFFSTNSEQFDFIYIDGDHHALSALLDGTNGFFCLKNGGLLAFDDYMWTMGQLPFDDPKPGIVAFLNIFGGQYSLLDMQGQVWIEKRG